MSIVEEVEKIVKKDILNYKNKALDHYDFWNEHIKYVYQESILLAKKYNANIEIVSLGALLHDIALIREIGDRKDHHINGKIIANEILTSLNYDNELKEQVLACVYNHRSSKNGNTIEELCVADADVLAHFDNIPMIFYSYIKRLNTPLEKLHDEIKSYLIKDYHDLSIKTQKDYKERFSIIYKSITGEDYE